MGISGLGDILTFEEKVAWDICVKFPLRVELLGHPPNVNHLYGRSRGRVFKNKKAVQWEALSQILIRSAAKNLYGLHDLSAFAHRPLEVEFAFYRSSWRGKTKAACERFVRRDIDNFLKSGVDVLCRTLGLEDAAIVSLKATKVESVGCHDKTIVELSFKA